MAPPLVTGGIDDIGVRWIEFEIGDAGVLVDRERLGPGGAAVGRAIDAALSARGPQRPFRGNESHITVARIDQDAADVFGLLQPHALPRPPRVAALVDTVAPADVPAAHVLAGADPDDLGT